jgi:hypothetical protein
MKYVYCFLTFLFFGGSVRAAEFLGEPCRAANILSSRVVRAAGKEYLALMNMNEISHAELILIDAKTGEGKVFKAPAGAGCWAMQQIDGDRLAMGTFYDGTFLIFDLKTMSFVKTIRFPGEEYLWEFARGSDGRLYAGTYPKGKLGALDLVNYHVEDFGNPAKPNMYCREVSALPDGRIYCRYGMQSRDLFIFDPKTKQFSRAPSQMEKTTGGVVWNHYFVGIQVYDGKSAIAFDTNLQAVIPPPFPLPSAQGAWRINASITTAEDLYLMQGQSLYHFRTNRDRLTKELEADLHGGEITGRSSDGTFFGVCGQRYFTIKTGQAQIQLHEYPGKLSPREILFLEADSRDVLWGGPTFAGTLFFMDAKTKQFTNTDRVASHIGEVYDVAFMNGKVYAVAYAGGDIIEYNPAESWDQFNDKNPHTISHLGDRGYIRPVAGIRAGDDHLLYSGWMANYGTYGGAIAVTDPASGKTELIENPLGEQGISGVEADDRYIYAGTSVAGNGLPSKHGASIAFGVINKTTHKVEFTQSFSGGSVHFFARDRKAGIVAFVTDTTIRLFDPSKMTTKGGPISTPANLPRCTGGSVVCRGNGHLYFGNGSTIFSLDLETLQFKTAATAPFRIGLIAISTDGAIYSSSGTRLYRVN